MNIDNLSELFDRYLENDLNTLEIQQFNQLLKDDSEFAERFRLHKEVDHALLEDDIVNFRLQLEKIGTTNSDLVQSAPMVIAEDLDPEIDFAILEQDVMALRNQLNRIHTSIIEEVDPLEIAGYAGIEKAILDQDTVALNKELIAFDELLLSDQFTADVEATLLSKDVDKAIMEDDVMALRAALSELGERAVISTKKVPITRRVIRYASTAVAAVFLLTIGSAILFNQNSSSLTSQRTISKYFHPLDERGVKRGPSEDAEKLIEFAIQKYNKADFRSASELFDLCMGDSIRIQTVLLYAGSSALMSGDPDRALRYFEGCDITAPAYEHVEWYTAECYLKKNDIEQAKAILKKISLDPDQVHRNDAAALLKRFGKE